MDLLKKGNTQSFSRSFELELQEAPATGHGEVKVRKAEPRNFVGPERSSFSPRLSRVGRRPEPMSPRGSPEFLAHSSRRAPGAEFLLRYLVALWAIAYGSCQRVPTYRPGWRGVQRRPAKLFLSRTRSHASGPASVSCPAHLMFPPAGLGPSSCDMARCSSNPSKMTEARKCM